MGFYHHKFTLFNLNTFKDMEEHNIYDNKRHFFHKVIQFTFMLGQKCKGIKTHRSTFGRHLNTYGSWNTTCI